MRTPDDMPRRRENKPSSARSVTRRRVLIGIAVGALLVFLLSLRGLAGLYTDYLWFDSLGQSGVWRGLVGARLVLAALFIFLFFAIAWVNLYVADRLAPPFRPAGPEDELLERYHELVAGRMHWVRTGVAAFLALIAGAGAGGEWSSWLLFTNGGDFGIQDPEFSQDVGFYVFKLPFLTFVVNWLFASVLIVLIVTAVAHYLNGGIRVQTAGQRVTPQVKAHLSVLLAALALIRAVDYYLQRFELTASGGGVVDGATYRDVNAQIPALNLLVLISLAGATLFIVNIFRRGWTLPIVAVAVWGFVAVVAGGIYPAYVQRFQVDPNESAREAPYIERNIEATRFALGVDDVQRERFAPNTRDTDSVNLAAYEPTLRNVRLWDPSDRISGRTFNEQQSIRAYYDISDVDVDRYTLDGEMTGVGLGLRTIDYGRVPIGGWEGRHLAYTHGYGPVLAPSGATERREPDFVIQDVPESITAEGLSVPQPRIYFGEDMGSYIMTGTGRDEIDYEDEEEGVVAIPYEGADGVEAGSLFRRLAFALRFGDYNPLISSFMSGDTKVHYNRDISDRIAELAPFLHADADPYPVLLDNRIVWVQDLYTTTDRFPYGQRANTDDLSSESGLRHGFNYVRNSVKATVDAYDGTVRFYVMDDEDPIIDAWRSAFPDLFTEGSEMPAELEPHLRYPEDLFRLQTTAWQRYHLRDVDAFYNQTNAWSVARDPGTAGADQATPVTDPSGEIIQVRDARIPPYYQLLQLPGGEELEFTLSRPFVPFSEDDQRQQLTGFMAARMDPGEYGELVVYEMPSGDLPQGPGIAASNIRSNEFVSREETLRSESGSTVLYGNLLMLPLGESLLYVQPFYVESEELQRPRLEQVILAFGEDVVMEETFQEALEALFGEQVETAEDPATVEGEDGDEPPDAEGEGEGEPEGEPEEPDEPSAADGSAARLVQEIIDLKQEADAALEDGDLGTYQERVNEIEARAEDLQQLLEGEDAAA